MSVDLLGPADAANSVTARPTDARVFGASDTFFKDCTSPTARDGTRIMAAYMNGILQQVRRAIRGMGVTENNANDDMLLTAIQNARDFYLIDTALVKTVHGGGADFTDMIAALEWLSKYRITQNGSVTFNLAVGLFAYAASVVINHPNSDKIVIAGAALLAAPPTRASFTVTGVNVTADKTADLTYLRTIYATELHFTGGNGVKFERGGGVTFKRILCTGDGSAPPGLGDGILIDAPGVSLAGGVSVHGFGAHGLNIRAGTTEFAGAVTATGNVLDGIMLQEGGQLFYIAEVCCMSNGGSGVACVGGVFRQGAGGASPASAQGNAQYGAAVQNGGSFGTAGAAQFSSNGLSGILATNAWLNVTATISGNIQWGIIATGARMIANGCVFSGNSGGSIAALGGAFVDATSSTGVSVTCTPAINTVGNNQSYIVN